MVRDLAPRWHHGRVGGMCLTHGKARRRFSVRCEETQRRLADEARLIEETRWRGSQGGRLR